MQLLFVILVYSNDQLKFSGWSASDTVLPTPTECRKVKKDNVQNYDTVYATFLSRVEADTFIRKKRFSCPACEEV